jgi:hypothetical protein
MVNLNSFDREMNILKPFLKAVIVIMIFSFSFELSNAQEYLPLRFNHFDSIPLIDNELGVKSIPWNGGILYLGYGIINNRPVYYNFSLILYDLDGNKTWERIYQFPPFNSYNAEDILSLDGNYLYIAGSITDNLNSDRFLCKLNSDGDTIFARKYLAQGDNKILDMEAISEDKIVILSVAKTEYNSEDIRTIIDIVDSTGAIIKTVEDNAGFKYPKEIIKYNDIIYVGGIEVPYPESLTQKIYISRYDLNLNYLGITNPSLTERETFFCFTKTDEHLLFTSRVLMQSQKPALYRTNISRVNHEGVLIDTNTFGPTDFAYHFATTTKFADEFIVTNLYEDLPKLYFHDLQLNPLCDYLIDIPYDEPFGAVITKITDISPNMISCTGHIGYLPPGGNKIKQWNLLTDDMVTFLYENCDPVSLIENTKKLVNYQVTQSISNNTITIESLSNDNNGNTEIRVFDLNGRLVLFKKFNKSTTINVQNFSQGLHILQFINGESFEIHKFIVY